VAPETKSIAPINIVTPTENAIGANNPIVPRTIQKIPQPIIAPLRFLRGISSSFTTRLFA